jgi:DNA-binding NtrC family response regulator
MGFKEDSHLLIVDDEADIVEIIAFSFKYAGFKNIHCAGSGNQAIALVKKQNFDLIVTDVRMPDGDGVFLLSEVRRICAKPPLTVFITAFADLDTGEALKMGAFALLSKPFDLNKVVGLCTQELEKVFPSESMQPSV